MPCVYGRAPVGRSTSLSLEKSCCIQIYFPDFGFSETVLDTVLNVTMIYETAYTCTYVLDFWNSHSNLNQPCCQFHSDQIDQAKLKLRPRYPEQPKGAVGSDECGICCPGVWACLKLPDLRRTRTLPLSDNVSQIFMNDLIRSEKQMHSAMHFL